MTVGSIAGIQNTCSPEDHLCETISWILWELWCWSSLLYVDPLKSRVACSSLDPLSVVMLTLRCTNSNTWTVQSWVVGWLVLLAYAVHEAHTQNVNGHPCTYAREISILGIFPCVHSVHIHVTRAFNFHRIPYIQKYWRDINLAVGPKLPLQKYWQI